MARRDTKACKPYSDADLVALGEHIARVVAATGNTPDLIVADVEFHGTYASTPHRRFLIEDLSAQQRARVVEVARKALRLQQEARTARPKSTYQAKGWQAQYRQLSRTVKGRTALDRAGVSATKRTRDKWLSGKQAAGRPNQEAIRRAYESIRMENVRSASEREQDAIRDVGQVFDEVMAEAYGDHGVRFRNIE